MYDIMLESIDKGNVAIIIEFKVQDVDDEASLRDTVEAVQRFYIEGK